MPTTTKELKEKTVKIKLPRARGDEENFIMVSLNGRSFKVMKGVEVEVPELIAEIIEDSLKAQDRADDYIESIVK